LPVSFAKNGSSIYIRSHAHAGWTLIKMRYDDGGFSGGSTDRPALQKLLDDVGARKINVIVVYKVDRLTRSLADFAKLVELFDAHGVSFVSVTQQFNTTTSMGRLTLNVLLSFAQFEREVTAERIRDKIAASKRKGLWVGGMVPLGYALTRASSPSTRTKQTPSGSFSRATLNWGASIAWSLISEQKGLTTKVRKLSSGAIRGGVPFTQGPDCPRFSYARRNDGCAYQPYYFWCSFHLIFARRLADHRIGPDHSGAIRNRESDQGKQAPGICATPGNKPLF
jgi:hypothetical protein